MEITTEHKIAQGRLDAFLSSSSIALVVESKLGSGYGDGQLMKYLAWLDAEFAERRYRGLITLTKRGAEPWPRVATDFAAARGITAQERLWEELHAALAPIAMDDSDQHALEAEQPYVQFDLQGQVVAEFLDMLTDEDLVPMPPLTGDELHAKWSESWLEVERYRDFFHACRDEIAEALDASPIGSSKSDRGDWFWQDYAFPSERSTPTAPSRCCESTHSTTAGSGSTSPRQSWTTICSCLRRRRRRRQAPSPRCRTARRRSLVPERCSSR